MKNSIRYNYRETNTYSSHSPLPSKPKPPTAVPLTSNLQYPRARHYKSPNSTPTTSPMPSRQVTTEEVSTCFSDKKVKEQYYYKQKITQQEKRIQILELENKKLSNHHQPDYWDNEMHKKNDEMRKLENQLKYYMELAADNNDKENLIVEISEKDKKIEDLTKDLETMNENLEDLKIKYLKVVKSNEKLKENEKMFLKKEECDTLMRQIQELEVTLEIQAKQFAEINLENEKLRKDVNVASLSYFAQDIGKIKVEMGKLMIVVEDFVKGKEISLKGLLGVVDFVKVEPVKQISNDIVSIKGDLNKILNIITDFHAEQSANMACRTQ